MACKSKKSKGKKENKKIEDKMKVEIKTNKNGICEYFKIDGKEYGNGIYELNIKIKPFELPEILIKAKSNEFILDSENNKLYLEKYEEK